MTGQGVLQVLLFLVVLALLAWPLGRYITRVFEGERTVLDPVLNPLERLVYRVSGIDATREQGWKAYAGVILLFNAIGLVAVYALQRLQGALPLNPEGLASPTADSAFNTAVSFATNTNWQGYGGETTMSYLTQMLGLGVQNFLSAATGIAVLIALVRGFVRRDNSLLGNAWVDLTRATLRVLLPMSLVLALVLVSQGVVQSFAAYKEVTLLQPLTVETVSTDAAGVETTVASTVETQVVPMGPAASQVAIKQLGRLDDTRRLRSYVKLLRQKLEPDPAHPRHLVTEVGVGYRLLAE